MEEAMHRRRVLSTAAAGLAAAAAAACSSTPSARTGEDACAPVIANKVFVGSDGTCFQLRTVGRGDLVVIHPSLARGAADFDDIARVIAAAGFQVVSFDPRGAGATRDTGALVARTPPVTLDDLARDVMEIVRAHGGRAHLIGHDYGNRVMRMVAVLAPDMVRSVTLWGAGSGAPPARAIEILTLVIDNRTPFPEFRAALAEGFFAPGNDPSVWYTGWYPVAGTLQVKASEHTPAARYQGGGNAPLLIVQAGQDTIAPPERSAQLQAAIGPRAQRVVIDKAGHCLVEEQPEAVAKATLQFLRQH